jgi:hypothetical protein
MTSLRMVPLFCLLAAATVTCRHEFPGDGDRSVTDRGADRPAPDAPRDILPGDGPADGPQADKPKPDGPRLDGPKPDKAKSDAPKPDARNDITQGPDKPVMCGATKAGDCFLNLALLCGADGNWHVDCAKCGCLLGGTCVNNNECKVVLNSTADSFTRKSELTNNFGSADTLRVGKVGTYELENSYLDFPVLTSIPSVASIQSAQLKLEVVTWGGPWPVKAEITLVGQAWGEMTITAGNAPAPLAGGPISTATLNWGPNVLDVTAHVAQWLSSSGNVHGLRVGCVDGIPRPSACIKDSGPVCGYVVFPASKENAALATRPVLEVIYK